MELKKGNFTSEAPNHRGWILGHFMGPDSPFATENVEIKWGNEPAGSRKEVAAQNTQAQSLAILIRGSFTFFFNEGEITLDKEGDYVFYPAGVSHSWVSNEDSLILTVRWPSIPNDQKPSV